MNFEGKRFIASEKPYTKREAQHKANEYREHGSKARVVKHGNGWYVYIRPGRKH